MGFLPIVLASVLARDAFALPDAEFCARPFERQAARRQRVLASFVALPVGFEVGMIFAHLARVPHAFPLGGMGLVAGVVQVPAYLFGREASRQERLVAGTIREVVSGEVGESCARTARDILESMKGLLVFVVSGSVNLGLQYPDYLELGAHFPDHKLSASMIARATGTMIERGQLCSPGREAQEFRNYVPNMSAALAEISESGS